MNENDFGEDEINLSNYIIFIGNPGVGKSTILNGLLRKVGFKSGFSAGKGLTQSLQLHKHTDGITYGDTPGLSDTKMRKIAAEEITKALQKNGKYKIIFVVTVEAGRVRPDDITTINLVLDSINHPVPFGVIVNKVSKVFVKKVTENKNNEMEEIFSGFNSGDHKTDHFYYFLKKEEYEDVDDVVPELPEDVLNFIYKQVPPVVIMKKNVKNIQLEQFEKMKEVFEQQIQMLKNNAQESKKFFEKTIEDLKTQNTLIVSQQEKQLKQMQEEHETLKGQLEKERIEAKKHSEEQNKIFEEQMKTANEQNKENLKQQKKLLKEQMEKMEQSRKENEENMVKKMEMMKETIQRQNQMRQPREDPCSIL